MHSGLRKRGVDDWRVQDFPEYAVWASMIDRCHVRTDKAFRDYGGRGIKVCGRWRKDFLQFLSDMGSRPDGRHSIERLDVDGDYEPGNCCWVTGTVQARNRRDTVFVEWEGERVKLADLCERLGCKRGVVYARLRIGWDIVRAVGRD